MSTVRIKGLRLKSGLNFAIGEFLPSSVLTRKLEAYDRAHVARITTQTIGDDTQTRAFGIWVNQIQKDEPRLVLLVPFDAVEFATVED